MEEQKSCINYPVCKCKSINKCEYNSDRQSEIKQLVFDYYENPSISKNRTKTSTGKPRRKHARNYTPPKKRKR